jgi:phenylacetate-CoA ligase
MPQPHNAEIWDEVETWSRDRLEAFQLSALKKQLARVGKQSRHYSAKFAEAGFDPEDFRELSDLKKLPLTRKPDYVEGIAAEPPYGTFVAADRKQAVRVHFSSGTTGKPTPVLWTQRDIDRWADLYARYFYAQGMRAGDVFQCMYNYSWFVGGLGATLAAQRLGALVVPGGSGDTKRQVETILEFGTKAVVGTPSFMAHIAETAAEMGVDLPSSSVGMVCCGGEPGASIPGTRERIERLWGARMFDCWNASRSAGKPPCSRVRKSPRTSSSSRCWTPTRWKRSRTGNAACWC